MSGLRRPSAAPQNGERVERTAGGEWEQLFPRLCEFLVEVVYEDGTARELPTLLVFVEEGVWKACLNDRDNGRTAWKACRTPDGLLELLEEGLEADTLEWRRRQAVPRKPK